MIGTYTVPISIPLIIIHCWWLAVPHPVRCVPVGQIPPVYTTTITIVTAYEAIASDHHCPPIYPLSALSRSPPTSPGTPSTTRWRVGFPLSLGRDTPHPHSEIKSTRVDNNPYPFSIDHECCCWTVWPKIVGEDAPGAHCRPRVQVVARHCRA